MRGYEAKRCNTHGIKLHIDSGEYTGVFYTRTVSEADGVAHFFHILVFVSDQLLETVSLCALSLRIIRIKHLHCNLIKLIHIWHMQVKRFYMAEKVSWPYFHLVMSSYFFFSCTFYIIRSFLFFFHFIKRCFLLFEFFFFQIIKVFNFVLNSDI